MYNEASFRIIGNIGTITSNAQDTVTWVTICAHLPYKTRDGEPRHRDLWNNVTIFQPGMRQYIAEHARSGDLVIALGNVSQRQRESPNGDKVYSVDLVASTFTILRHKNDSELPPDAAEDNGDVPF